MQLPKLGGEATPPYVWLYFGNEHATPAADPQAVWDANQALVLHFSGKNALTTDATGFGNNASQSSATAAVSGQIDAAAHYDGTQFTTVPASPSLKLAAATGFTFSAWIKSEGPQQNATLFQQQDGARSLTIALNNDQPVATLSGDDGKLAMTPLTAKLAPGEWHHLAVTASDRLVVGPEVGGNGAGGPAGQGGGGGPMAKFAPYAYKLRDTITAALNARPELRVANYDAVVQIWIDPDGGIRRVALAKSTGTAKIDAALRNAVEAIQKLSLATPPDMPQPVDLRIVSKGASGFDQPRRRS